MVHLHVRSTLVGNTNWEGSYRVPAMVRWPDQVKPGTEINDIVSPHDLLDARRIAEMLASDEELMLEADVGGFGAGSNFSWQVVGTYGFDVHCFGTPFHTVIGYRASPLTTVRTAGSAGTTLTLSNMGQ